MESGDKSPSIRLSSSKAIVPLNYFFSAAVRKKREASPEQAGVHFEVNRVRHELLYGERTFRCISPVSVRKVLLHLGWENETEAEEAEDVQKILNSATDEADEDGVDFIDPDDEKYERFLTGLDPTECKNQDHYRVLGLSKLRYSATDDQIRTAYRRKVLKHHPDKRRHRGVQVRTGEEDYFTCITRAFETLGHAQKRRAYDSVDPSFDNSTPSGEPRDFEDDFFEEFTPVFERNARWSTVNPVPLLGNEQSSMESVEDFYNFWFEFHSWREFSYMDEEDKEKGECREERRWIDKQNKAAREKRKKEENKRIRNMVELAYQADPRILKFREEEKQRKEAGKKAKKDAIRFKKEAEQKERKEAEERERLRLEQEAQEKKKQQDEEKRRKQTEKKALQKERKDLREFCKGKEYFTSDSAARLKAMEDVEKLCRLFSTDQLSELNNRLRSPNGSSSSDVFSEAVKKMDAELAEEKAKQVQSQATKSEIAESGGKKSVRWNEEELQLLVKGATLFPVGTKSRWEVIAAFINEHRKEEAENRPKNAKDVIAMAKTMQNNDMSVKAAAVSTAPLLTSKKKDENEHRLTSVPTERTEAPSELLGEAAWTVEEQKLLEQALKTYPASTAQRWECIAECIPGKTKKDCIKRYKELAELVRAKKAAQEKVLSDSAQKK